MSGSTKTKASSAGKQDNEATPDVGAAAAEAGHQVQEQVGNLTGQVRKQATDQIASQKERVADTLDTVALLLHEAGEHATKEDNAMIAGYADKASGQVTHWSDKLRDQDVTQLLEETKQLARRQPLLFFSGALAAGFVGSRFFRSSTQQAEHAKESDSSTGGGDSTASESSSSERDTSASASSDTADTALAMPLPSDLALESEMTPEMVGYLEDIEETASDANEFEVTTLVDLDDLTRPEQR